MLKDACGTASQHLQFIAEQLELWKGGFGCKLIPIVHVIDLVNLQGSSQHVVNTRMTCQRSALNAAFRTQIQFYEPICKL